MRRVAAFRRDLARIRAIAFGVWVNPSFGPTSQEAATQTISRLPGIEEALAAQDFARVECWVRGWIRGPARTFVFDAQRQRPRGWPGAQFNGPRTRWK